MGEDAYGLPLTTTADAGEAYDLAVHAFLGWDVRTLDLFQAAADRDPALALAHAGAAVCLFLEERFAEARAAGERARAAAAGQSERERSHVEAVALWVGGQVGPAEQAMRAHLAAYPRDFTIAQRLYFIWFWQGRFPEMLDLTRETVRRHPGDSFALGLHAFALEQADLCPEALATAEAALALNPRNGWAVHALAHTLYETASFDAALTRLPPAIHPCTQIGWFRNHLLWHLTLMHLSRGDYARAARLSRTVFERAPSSIASDLHDSISLLWRLQLCGVEVEPARWRPFAEIARGRLARAGLLFHAAHLAMALVAAGEWATAERQLETLRERSGKDRTGLTAEVLVPLIEGLHAFAGGDYARSIERIESVRTRIVELGGSRAQRDIFHDTMLEACFRAGDAGRAERLLAERVARRPDHFWVTRRERGAAVTLTLPR